MKQIYGVSVSGNMEEAFLGVPSIGGIGQGYGDAKYWYEEYKRRCSIRNL